MAYTEHLKILEKGVDEWNEWRREHPNFEPNLTEADLSGADLFKADLFKADLFNANLREADLSGAKNLTTERLSKVKTLYKAKLDPELEKQIEEKYPHLLEMLKVEEK